MSYYNISRELYQSLSLEAQPKTSQTLLGVNALFYEHEITENIIQEKRDQPFHKFIQDLDSKGYQDKLGIIVGLLLCLDEIYEGDDNRHWEAFSDRLKFLNSPLNTNSFNSFLITFCIAHKIPLFQVGAHRNIGLYKSLLPFSANQLMVLLFVLSKEGYSDQLRFSDLPYVLLRTRDYSELANYVGLFKQFNKIFEPLPSIVNNHGFIPMGMSTYNDYFTSTLRNVFRTNGSSWAYEDLEYDICELKKEIINSALIAPNLKSQIQGNFWFVYNPKNQELNLCADAYLGKAVFNDFSFCQNSDKINGVFLSPLQVNGSQEVSFIEYTLGGRQCPQLSTNINAVNYFQLFEGLYVQTTVPQPGIKSYVVVQKNEEIEGFDHWVNTHTQNHRKIDIHYSGPVFGNDYTMFITDSVDVPIGVSVENNQNQRKVLQLAPGRSLPGQPNTYNRVRLPQFLIQFDGFERNQLRATFNRVDLNGISDKNFSIEYINNRLCVCLDKDFDILDPIAVQIVLSYNEEELFNHQFQILPDTNFTIEDDQIYRFNGWGIFDKAGSIKGNGFINGQQINIGGGRHKIEGIQQADILSENFLYGLNNLFVQKEGEVSKNVLEKFVENEIELIVQENPQFKRTDYSIKNLLNNLNLLGYIHTIRSDNTTTYQGAKLSLVAIENAFTTSGAQVKKLMGLRGRKLTLDIIHHCAENMLEFKYRTKEDGTLNVEDVLTPNTLLLDSRFSTEKFKEITDAGNVCIASSLLQTMCPISNYEKSFLTKAEIEFNVPLSIPKTDTFPRIRSFVDNRKVKAEVLEKRDGEIYTNYPKKWAHTYVRYQNQEPSLFMNYPRWGDNKFNLVGEVMLYKFQQNPTIIEKCLTLFNHHLPSTKKVFVVNNPIGGNAVNFTYNEFNCFKIGNDLDRRNLLVEKLTGNFLVNPNNPRLLVENSGVFHFIKPPKWSMQLFTFKGELPLRGYAKITVLKKNGNPVAYINYHKELFLVTGNELCKSNYPNTINDAISSIISGDHEYAINGRSFPNEVLHQMCKDNLFRKENIEIIQRA